MAGNRINIRGFRYAKLEKDAPGTVLYSTVKEIPGAMTVGITPNVAKAALFGDGRKRSAKQRLTGYEIAVEMNKIPMEDRAVWSGNEIDENGVLHVKATDSPPYIAIGFIVDLDSDKDVEVSWFLKCSVSPISNNMQQTTDNINYSTDNISLQAVFRDFDEEAMIFADTSAEPQEGGKKFTLSDVEAFLATVPGNVPTL